MITDETISCYRINYNVDEWDKIISKSEGHGPLEIIRGATRAVNALCDEIERLKEEIREKRYEIESLSD